MGKGIPPESRPELYILLVNGVSGVVMMCSWRASVVSETLTGVT